MTVVKLKQPRPLGNLLEDWFQEFPSLLGREFSHSLPQVPVNIVETSEAYHLEMNAPGRNKEDFNLSVDAGLLTISCEQKKEDKQAQLKVVRKEFGTPSFKRSFSIDEKIDALNIQAKYEAGLLKVYLPKMEAVKVQPREITIQ